MRKFLILLLFNPIFISTPSLATNIDIFDYGLTSTRLGDGNAIVLENRLRMEQQATLTGAFSLQYKLDGVQDMAGGDAFAEVREAYLAYSGKNWEIHGGRKIVTWGVADLLFINDVFPKNYESFFAGRPMEYLKKPSDGIFFSYFGKGWSADFFSTTFEKDVLPSSNRFRRLPNPFAGIPQREKIEPEKQELAFRIYGTLKNFDVSVYFSAGYFNQPSFQMDDPQNPTKLTLLFPRLNTYGLSLQGPARGGLLTIEAGYYDSTKDRSGNNPIIPNSEFRFLAGYQKELATDFTAGIQYYAQWLQDYASYKSTLPPGFPPQDEIRHIFTFRLMRLLNYQTLRLSFFGFYSPSDGDSFHIPEVSYAISDTLSITLGVNLFHGSSITPFGALNSNDSIYFYFRKSL